MAHTISAGEYVATVVAEGAGLASLTFQGNDLVVPHDPNETPEGYSGKVLIPWPNRVAGGKYKWEGKTLQLPVNEPERGAALHGLRAEEDWQVTDVGASHVTLETEILPTEGYPFHLVATTSYSLEPEGGLTVTITTRNSGADTAPYGVSIHPYLTCGVPVEECVLRVPAASITVMDQVMTPVGVTAVEGEMDLRDPISLKGRKLDDAFTDLPEGAWTVTLADPETGRAVELRASTRWVQVFAGEKLGKKGVAVEPMTCPADAFNSGTDLIVLAPGEQNVFTASISAAPTV